jgi:hypothetical protein
MTGQWLQPLLDEIEQREDDVDKTVSNAPTGRRTEVKVHLWSAKFRAETAFHASSELHESISNLICSINRAAEQSRQTSRVIVVLNCILAIGTIVLAAATAILAFEAIENIRSTNPNVNEVLADIE